MDQRLAQTIEPLTLETVKGFRRDLQALYRQSGIADYQQYPDQLQVEELFRNIKGYSPRLLPVLKAHFYAAEGHFLTEQDPDQVPKAISGNPLPRTPEIEVGGFQNYLLMYRDPETKMWQQVRRFVTKKREQNVEILDVYSAPYSPNGEPLKQMADIEASIVFNLLDYVELRSLDVLGYAEIPEIKQRRLPTYPVAVTGLIIFPAQAAL